MTDEDQDRLNLNQPDQPAENEESRKVIAMRWVFIFITFALIAWSLAVLDFIEPINQEDGEGEREGEEKRCGVQLSKKAIVLLVIILAVLKILSWEMEQLLKKTNKGFWMDILLAFGSPP